MNDSNYMQLALITAESRNFAEFSIKATLEGYDVDEVKFDFVKLTIKHLVNLDIEDRLNEKLEDKLYEADISSSVVKFISSNFYEDPVLRDSIASALFIGYVFQLIALRYKSDTYSLETEAGFNQDYNCRCKVRDRLLSEFFTSICKNYSDVKLLQDKDGNNVLQLILYAYNVIDKIENMIIFYEPRVKSYESYYNVLEKTFGDTARAFMLFDVDPFHQNNNKISFASVLGPYYEKLIVDNKHNNDIFYYV